MIACGKKNRASTIKSTNTAQENTLDSIKPKIDHQVIEVKKATITPNIDGSIDDPIWKETAWLPLDQKWIGPDYTTEDFSGRYKLAWTPEALYLIAEIIDDTIYDQRKDPLKFWWDDDCLEIFIDADNSGGGHQFNNNAFAYHVALDQNVVDLTPEETPILYNDHIKSKMITTANTSIWELEIAIYDDTYDPKKVNDQMVLTANQKIGFALAYNDNDASKERENFIGSVFVPGEDKNQGWINADIFGTIVLKE